MTAFLLRRLIETAILLAAMSFAIYGLIGLMPGDPIDLMMTADPRLTSADIARLKSLYGLDQPLVDRYLAWAGNAIQGDFGYSRIYAQPAADVIGDRLGNTILLMGGAFALALALALPLGMLAAWRSGRPLDHAINLVAFAGISVPQFWLAILAIILFAVVLGWLPAGGMGDGSFEGTLRHLVLPVVTLAIASAGGILRYVRASMREALRQDFIRTARAKGVSTARLLWFHALRNAMIPVVTILALDFGALFSGALITETMFSWLGMGKTIYDAIMGNDYNLALLGLMIATALVLTCNLLADLAYAWLDPRVRYR
ncbi:MAG: ABC transporter permease [Dongiaceae bacterium]